MSQGRLFCHDIVHGGLLFHLLFVLLSLAALVLFLDMLKDLLDWCDLITDFLSQHSHLEHLLEGNFNFHRWYIDVKLELIWVVLLLNILSILYKDIGWMQNVRFINRATQTELRLLHWFAVKFLNQRQLSQISGEVVLINLKVFEVNHWYLVETQIDDVLIIQALYPFLISSDHAWHGEVDDEGIASSYRIMRHQVWLELIVEVFLLLNLLGGMLLQCFVIYLEKAWRIRRRDQWCTVDGVGILFLVSFLLDYLVN